MNKKKDKKELNRELLANDSTHANTKNTGAISIEDSGSNQWNEKNDEQEETGEILKNVDYYYQLKKFDSKKAWQNVSSKIQYEGALTIQRNNLRKEAVLKFYKYAAIVVIALFLGITGYYLGFVYQKPAGIVQISSASEGVVNEYVLPDGSVVTLNSNSNLEFPEKFKNDVREVTINGEAFFDVIPNPLVPFVIHAGNTQIKVLGTSFNVSAYPETKTVEVVVKTGKVQVSEIASEDQEPIQEVLLDPGEKSTFFSENNILEKSLNTDPNYFSWKTHDLIFNETPLKDVVKSLEKVYHIHIQLSNPELNDKLITVQFNKKPVDFVMEVIRQTFNLSLTEKNGQFIFSNQKENLKS